MHTHGDGAGKNDTREDKHNKWGSLENGDHFPNKELPPEPG